MASEFSGPGERPNGGATNVTTRTGLLGPYRLTVESIRAAVTRESAGVYAIGHADALGRFCVAYIGRSDRDVGAELRGYIGSDTLFKYGYFPSAQAAFVRECQLFHDIGPPLNRVHPGRPKGTNLLCPRCQIYDRP
jgi:hypothetical protein